MLSLLIILFGMRELFAQSIPVPPTPTERAVFLGNSVAIVDRVNIERLKRGLNALDVDDTLTCAAAINAAFLAIIENVCSHDAQGNLADRFNLCGAEYGAGEVIACGYQDIESAVEGWMKSPSHYKMLMNPNLRRMGGTVIQTKFVVTVGY